MGRCLLAQMSSMEFWQSYSLCAVGVVLSIVIPVLSGVLRRKFSTGGAATLTSLGSLLNSIWRVAKPYVSLGAFSLAVSVLIVAFLGKSITTWQEALIAGYLWDSTLQKISGKP